MSQALLDQAVASVRQEPSPWDEPVTVPPPARSHAHSWAAAVLAAAALALAVWFFAPHSATVITLDGALQGPHGPLAPGDTAAGGVPLRTGPNTDAMLRLGDGSVVELGASTTVQLKPSWRGHTIALNAGRVLVEAAKQHWGRHLYVAAANTRVAVVGTIFEVDATPAGARVAVVEGRVSVTTPRADHWLTGGQAVTSNPLVPSLSAGATVAWSKNAPIYWAMLGYVPPSAAPTPLAPAPAESPLAATPVAPSAPPTAKPQAQQQIVTPPAQPSQSVQTPKPAATPMKPEPPQDPVLLLLQQAENAVANVPAEAQPSDLMDVAEAYDVHHPDLARDLVVRAFHDAVNLSRPSDDSDPLRAWHDTIKANLEMEAVDNLADRPGDFEIAHELAKSADWRHQRIYDGLIAGTLTQAEEKAGLQLTDEGQLLTEMYGPGSVRIYPPGFRPPKGIQPPFDVLTLANECYQSDGSFPYLGVNVALSSYHTNDTDQRPLVLAAYHAAAGETDLQAMNGAVNALGAGHRVYPDLDQQMESAGESLLKHLADAAHNPPTGGIPAHQQYVHMLIQSDIRSGAQLLSLIKQVDSVRGAELAAEYAVFPAPTQPQGIPISSLTEPQRAANADPVSALATANAMPSISDQQKTAKFLSLARLAVTLSQKNPEPAARAAAEALDLMTDDMVTAHVDEVGLLALRMGTDLHENGPAHDLMVKALDAAESIAESKEKAFDDAGDVVTKRQDADDFTGVGAPEVEVWAYAGLLDPTLAQSRAEATSATYFKPLFLLRVAVGEEMHHPWWN